MTQTALIRRRPSDAWGVLAPCHERPITHAIRRILPIARRRLGKSDILHRQHHQI
jgi:hypothetical protein